MTKIKMHEAIPGFKTSMGRKARESLDIDASEWIVLSGNIKLGYVNDYLVDRLASAELELARIDSTSNHFRHYKIGK